MDFLSVVSAYEEPDYRQPLGFLVPRLSWRVFLVQCTQSS